MGRFAKCWELGKLMLCQNFNNQVLRRSTHRGVEGSRVLYHKRYKQIKWGIFLSAMSKGVVPRLYVVVTIESVRRSLVDTLMVYS